MMYTRKKHPFSPSIKERVAALRALDNWHAFVAVMYDYLVIAAGIYFFLLSPWLYPISLILIGSRQRALATILHESAHRCIAKSSRLNRFIGTYLSGYLILQELNVYSDSHIKQHHAFLGDKKRDPDLIYHHEQGLYKTQSKQS